jgi:hypothetical protein
MKKSFNADLEDELWAGVSKKTETHPSSLKKAEEEHKKLEMSDSQVLKEMKKRGQAIIEGVDLPGN